MTPAPERFLACNSSVQTLLPYPLLVMAKTNSFFCGEDLRTLMSAILSPSFNRMLLTPLEDLPVGLNFEALNLAATPLEVPMSMSSSSVHFSHHFNLSLFSKVAIFNP